MSKNYVRSVHSPGEFLWSFPPHASHHLVILVLEKTPVMRIFHMKVFVIATYSLNVQLVIVSKCHIDRTGYFHCVVAMYIATI